VIFGGVPVLGDKNCHGLGKRERGEEEKKRKKDAMKRYCFVDRRMSPPSLCDVLNE
jgi:hypothetical protein